ncbi:MAG TPA: family 20 glycosylhydrolase [Puia sp.]|nr:family 20 glycosylhydrolase [Puia sp.]
MKTIVAIVTILFTLDLQAQQVNVTPKPVSLVVHEGSYEITPQTKILVAKPELQKSADFFNDYLQKFYGFKLPVVTKHTGNSIELAISKNNGQPNHADGYTLITYQSKAVITGQNDAGVFYGIQTMIQLLPTDKSSSLKIPAVTIEDYPRFSYRGLMLDCGRHFFAVDFVKQYIDFIALHKMNTFHWHLTEDQGWRIEIKKYPRLTEIGSCRNGTIIGHHPGTGNDSIKNCGYYTQEQIKEIVQYAEDRYITIIPEIEMPGHSSAAIAAYPQLSCFPDSSTQIAKGVVWAGTGVGKQVQQSWGVYRDVYCPSDYTFTFLEDVLDEVMQLFPSKYIHIGGDECPKDFWKHSAFCQNLIKEKGLKDEEGLQSYFIQRVEKYLNSKGRNIIGWDEILEGGLAPNATVMSWRGEKGGIDAAKQHHQVVMTPTTYVYFDYSQTHHDDSLVIGGFLPLEKVYNYEPLPKELNEADAKYIIGAQSNVWTEYMSNPGKVEYMIFPRLTALSEVLWTPKENKNWDDFEKRLPGIFKRYEFWGVSYSKAFYDLKASILPAPDNDGVLWKLETRPDAGTPKYATSKTSVTLNDYTNPIAIKINGEYGAVLYKNGKIMSNWLWQKFYFNKATGKKISLKSLPADKYPGNVGEFGLVNGAMSETGINSEEWLGWNGGDMVAIIDLGKEEQITGVNAHFIDQRRSQVYPPAFLEAFSSADGINFTSLGKTTVAVAQALNMIMMNIQVSPVAARYIKVVAENYGKIPVGEPGAGNPAWLFCDEIGVN